LAHVKSKRKIGLICQLFHANNDGAIKRLGIAKRTFYWHLEMHGQQQ